jgi:peptide-N4-(N-acetyl-beta-glucosaminyl)asparagine amidase
VEELVEFIIPNGKDVKESEMQGRQSGSLAWRLARQEIHEEDQPGQNGYEWQICSNKIPRSDFQLTYDPVSDSYRNSCNANILKGWRNGTFYVENIFRKEEKDWKMVYLARQENANGNNSRGKIAWKFTIPASCSEVEIAKISLEMLTQTYGNAAKILIQVTDSQNNEVQIPETCCQNGIWKWEKALTEGVRSVLISVELTGGSGAVAWQHAQLFRASTVDNSSRDPKQPLFRLQITFKN